VARQELQGAGRAGAAELGVRLVDDEQALVELLAQRGHHLGLERRAGRVVRRRQEYDVWSPRADQRHRAVGVEGEVLLAVPDLPGGVGVPGVLRVHRVGRGEAQRQPARAAERLEQVEHHLVRAVGRPDLLRGDAVPEVARERLPQGEELAVGVAVQLARRLGDGPLDVGHHGRGRRVGVLVDVEADGDVELRGAVGLQTAQLLPQREGAHRPNRMLTAWP
jgi:hypothetical protein